MTLQNRELNMRMNRLIAACFVLSALFAVPAFAQESDLELNVTKPDTSWTYESILNKAKIESLADIDKMQQNAETLGLRLTAPRYEALLICYQWRQYKMAERLVRFANYGANVQVYGANYAILQSGIIEEPNRYEEQFAQNCRFAKFSLIADKVLLFGKP